MSVETKKKKLKHMSGGLKKWKISYTFKPSDFVSKTQKRA